jgi:hypothetical protein
MRSHDSKIAESAESVYFSYSYTTQLLLDRYMGNIPNVSIYDFQLTSTAWDLPYLSHAADESRSLILEP